ncbi:hypothetical protein BJ741DRAFT_631802 [Chytriomyces cf. hyalinus JEL632]|nr:hypothetical protein BJ741DRAFT_631802 [Chytriomyces cf. hyalinus JEL632]
MRPTSATGYGYSSRGVGVDREREMDRKRWAERDRDRERPTSSLAYSVHPNQPPSTYFPASSQPASAQHNPYSTYQYSTYNQPSTHYNPYNAPYPSALSGQSPNPYNSLSSLQSTQTASSTHSRARLNSPSLHQNYNDPFFDRLRDSSTSSLARKRVEFGSSSDIEDIDDSGSVRSDAIHSASQLHRQRYPSHGPSIYNRNSMRSPTPSTSSTFNPSRLSLTPNYPLADPSSPKLGYMNISSSRAGSVAGSAAGNVSGSINTWNSPRMRPKTAEPCLHQSHHSTSSPLSPTASSATTATAYSSLPSALGANTRMIQTLLEKSNLSPRASQTTPRVSDTESRLENAQKQESNRPQTTTAAASEQTPKSVAASMAHPAPVANNADPDSKSVRRLGTSRDLSNDVQRGAESPKGQPTPVSLTSARDGRESYEATVIYMARNLRQSVRLSLEINRLMSPLNQQQQQQPTTSTSSHTAPDSSTTPTTSTAHPQLAHVTGLTQNLVSLLRSVDGVMEHFVRSERIVVTGAAVNGPGRGGGGVAASIPRLAAGSFVGKTGAPAVNGRTVNGSNSGVVVNGSVNSGNGVRAVGGGAAVNGMGLGIRNPANP